MEVHHPHHPTHKKKWSEYLLEFFMLFFAVTLGFFAENIREKITDDHKKTELLKAVSKDFEKDIKQLNFHKSFDLNKIKICDSINNILEQDPTFVDQQTYYRLFNNSYTSWKFNSNSRSRMDAEAKGYFSDVENTELAYYISKYTFHQTDLLDVTIAEQQYYDHFFESNNIKKYVDVNKQRVAGRFPRINLPMGLGIKKINEQDKETFKFHLIGVREFNDISIYNIDSLQFYAKKAIDYINNKYK